jgi:hypothetical protein
VIHREYRCEPPVSTWNIRIILEKSGSISQYQDYRKAEIKPEKGGLHHIPELDELVTSWEVQN